MNNQSFNASGTIKSMKKNGSGFKLDDGEWYSVRPADKDRLMGAGYGDSVSLEYSITSKNGVDYRNIEGRVEVTQKSNVAPPQASGGGFRPANNNGPVNDVVIISRDQAIIRQTCIKAAAELCAADGGSATAEEVITFARMFEAYCTGQLDKAEARAVASPAVDVAAASLGVNQVTPAAVSFGS